MAVSTPTPARPRKMSDVNNLSITIDSPSPNKMSYQNVSHKDESSNVLFSLEIPHRLLYAWQQNRRTRLYTELVNEKIKNQTAKLVIDCPAIEERIAIMSRKIGMKVRRFSGRKREYILDRTSHLFVKEGEARMFNDHVDKLEEMVTEQRTQLNELRSIIQAKDNEIHEILEQNRQAPKANKGKRIHELSQRQQNCKLSECTTYIEQALWFCDSFGLTAESIELRKTATGSPVKIQLTEKLVNETNNECNKTEKVCQALYILDRFAVSDEAYHELSITSNLPPVHHIKQKRLELNSAVDIQPLQQYQGAYRPVKMAIYEQISRMISMNISVNSPVKVKVSGDGARLTKSSGVTSILLSFSFPGTEADILSGKGNHTFAGIKAGESFETISEGFREVTDQLNALIEDPTITIGDTTFNLEEITRWNTEVDIEEYTSTSRGARTLEKIRQCAKIPRNRPIRERLGVKEMPILSIEPHHIIPDELHLMLRVGDVLIRNLINCVVATSLRERKGIQHVKSSLNKVEQAASEIGITFRIWEERGADGKPSGTYGYNSLRGNDVVKLLQQLPMKFAQFMDEDIQHLMARIWIEFYQLHQKLSCWEPPLSCEELHTQAKDWIVLFLSLSKKCEGFQHKHVTPYMHIMVYHFPHFIKLYGNIKQFSGQGVEKNNDDARRFYFSSNFKEPIEEILRAESRVERTSLYKRQKRPYNKKASTTSTTQVQVDSQN